MHIYTVGGLPSGGLSACISLLQGSQVYGRMKQLYKAFISFSIDPVSKNITAIAELLL